MFKWTLPALLAFPLLALADDKPKPKTEKKPVETFIDAAKAGPDFAVQGEYVGMHNNEKMGVQVYAQGDGQFHIKVCIGGLPGDGWDGKTAHHFKAKMEDASKMTFQDEKNPDHKGEATVADGKVTVKIGEDSFVLTKVMRKSPTEGAKPPEGAIVLFDGTNLEQWSKGDGKTLPTWIVEDGYTQVKGGDIHSKAKFAGPHSIHVEFFLPFMPRATGQGRANSGVYIQNRYEVQVLDSFGLKGENNEAGGIYSQTAPSVNMCYPPLQWQTFDIDVTPPKFEGVKKVANARVTVKHNGVMIHDNVEIKGSSGGGAAEDETPQGIRLQDHGNPMRFRNIWVVEKR